VSDPSSLRATVGCLSCGKLKRVELGRLADRPRCAACQRPLHFDRHGTATDATLPKILSNTSVPILVDFYADWCGPCKVMAPLLDDFARARKSSVIVLKLDTDRNPASARGWATRRSAP
jgi:thioredoxin 2